MRVVAAVAAMLVVLLAVVVYGAAYGGKSIHHGGQSSSGWTVDQVGRSVVVTGCQAEDSCSIDYTSSGTWVITRRPAGTW
jgi:hypothetical protein